MKYRYVKLKSWNKKISHNMAFQKMIVYYTVIQVYSARLCSSMYLVSLA